MTLQPLLPPVLHLTQLTSSSRLNTPSLLTRNGQDNFSGIRTTRATPKDIPIVMVASPSSTAEEKLPGMNLASAFLLLDTRPRLTNLYPAFPRGQPKTTGHGASIPSYPRIPSCRLNLSPFKTT